MSGALREAARFGTIKYKPFPALGGSNSAMTENQRHTCRRSTGATEAAEP